MSRKLIRLVKIILNILSFIFFIFSIEGGFKTSVEPTTAFMLTGILFRNFNNKQCFKLYLKLQLLIFDDKIRILSHLKFFVELTLSDLITLRGKTLLLLISITEVFGVRLTTFYLKMFRGMNRLLYKQKFGRTRENA